MAADVSEGRLVITHDGSLAPFAAGDVLAGTAGGGFLARVASVRPLDATRVELGTTPAQLTDLLREADLHIHYDAKEYQQRLQEFADAQRERGDEDGEKVASEAEALTIKASGSIPLLHLIGATLPAACHVETTGKGTLDVDATLDPSIDIELKIGPKGGLNPLPEVKHFRFVASGDLDIQTSLHAEGKISGGCTLDLLALAGESLSVPLPPLTFWVGPVPVIITTSVVPIARADLSFSLESAQVDAQSHTTVGLSAGVDYASKKWSTVWEPTCESTGTASVQSDGNISAACKVTAGAELRARLYGVVGPNVGVEAYARATADTAPPYCTYDGIIDGGVDAYAAAALDISIGPVDVAIAKLDLVRLDLLHVDGPQFSGQLRDAPECSGDGEGE